MARRSDTDANGKTPVSTPDETLRDLLDPRRHKRSDAPLRRAFIQHPDKPKTPGPLHGFVVARRELALDLLLLVHCAASAEPWDVALPAMAWARALNLPTTASSESTVSKNWSWLEKRNFIHTDRHLRMRRVFLKKEDASGDPYSRNKGEERGYFRLPYAYFLDRWHERLSLPAKATLLICLAQSAQFELRTEHASTWLGLSPDSLQRGLDELAESRLLLRRTEFRSAPRARYGRVGVRVYQLLGPFMYRGSTKTQKKGKAS